MNSLEPAQKGTPRLTDVNPIGHDEEVPPPRRGHKEAPSAVLLVLGRTENRTDRAGANRAIRTSMRLAKASWRAKMGTWAWWRQPPKGPARAARPRCERRPCRPTSSQPPLRRAARKQDRKQ